LETKNESMKYLVKLLILCPCVLLGSCGQADVPGNENQSASAQGFFDLRRYDYHTTMQEKQMDDYFSNVLIPALHRLNTGPVGVFKPHDQTDSSIWVLVPHASLEDFAVLEDRLISDSSYMKAAMEWNNASFETPPFLRMESYLLRSFSGSPGLQVPDFNTPGNDRVYELRSYESATEELHRRKVEMFEEGESQLFIDLGFQPVFFARALSSARMPHLMYMTTHADNKTQAENWAAFREHPEWIHMKDLEQYKHTVSHIDIYLLYPTPYSDY